MATLLPSNTHDEAESRQRGSRQRLISILSLVVAIVGISFLVSLKNHSSTGSTVRGSSVADMQSFAASALISGQPTHAPVPALEESVLESKGAFLTSPIYLAVSVQVNYRKYFDHC